MNNNKYYVVKNNYLANALTFVTGQKPFMYDSNEDSGKKVWSFRNDTNFQEAIQILTELKNKNIKGESTKYEENKRNYKDRRY